MAENITQTNAELAPAEEDPGWELVLVVEREPDYWSRGHFYQGTKPWIDPTAVKRLQIGDRLYRRATPGGEAMNQKKQTTECDIDTIKQFIDVVKDDIDSAYDVFEERCSDDLRDKIYGLGGDSPEPFRAAMIFLGFKDF